MKNQRKIKELDGLFSTMMSNVLEITCVWKIDDVNVLDIRICLGVYFILLSFFQLFSWKD